MFLSQKTKSGKTVAIVVRTITKERLSKTCFRGGNLPCAGNFMHFTCADDVFDDKFILSQLLAEVEVMLKEEDFGQHSLEIDYPEPVGWDSTDEKRKYRIKDLEEFAPNNKSTALRIKPSLVNLYAPQTKRLTIVYEFKLEDGKPAVVVHSIYPGKDIGQLRGNVTQRENRIFFHWDHPGQLQ